MTAQYLHDKLPDHYLDDNEVESRNAEEFLGAIAEMNETGDQQRVRSLMVGKQINLSKISLLWSYINTVDK